VVVHETLLPGEYPEVRYLPGNEASLVYAPAQEGKKPTVERIDITEATPAQGEGDGAFATSYFINLGDQLIFTVPKSKDEAHIPKDILRNPDATMPSTGKLTGVITADGKWVAWGRESQAPLVVELAVAAGYAQTEEEIAMIADRLPTNKTLADLRAIANPKPPVVSPYNQYSIPPF